MMKLTPLARVLTLGLGCVGLAAQAQQADAKKEEPIKLERVEITGSNIKRVNAETAVPVQVITRSEIDAKGFTTVKALLDNLSTATGGLSDIRGGNSFSSGSSAISMRNMGSGSTLVLLNGRRLAPYGFANFSTQFTNIDSLPFEAIERVEVLKDGASALYGSDAVAGVINYVLKKSYQGMEAGAQWGGSQGGIGQSRSANVAFGFGDLSTDRYNV
jgi:iron complex outermembrane receptor protein